MSNQPAQPEAEILRLWDHFKGKYAQLGYRRASFAYFGHWLHKEAPHLAEIPTDEIQRRLHAYRKRQRMSRRLLDK